MNIKDASIIYRDTGIKMNKAVFNDSKAVIDYMRNAFDAYPYQEQVWVILVDNRLQAFGRILCCLGTASNCVINPSEIFRPAILSVATGIILVHNHPSGIAEPSPADYELTQIFVKCGNILEIQLLDHVIIGDEDYYSFEENNMLP